MPRSQAPWGMRATFDWLAATAVNASSLDSKWQRASDWSQRPSSPPKNRSRFAPPSERQRPPPFASGSADPSSPPFHASVTLYSPPVRLKFGEVFNYFEAGAGGGQPPRLIRLPEEVTSRYNGTENQMAIRSYSFDIVRRDSNGTESSVPLYELYDHHHMVEFFEAGRTDWLRPALSIGASFEFRGITSEYEAPYRRVIGTPDAYSPLMHLINTKHPTQPPTGRASPLIQCPCTPQRRIDVNASTVDGYPIHLGCHRDIGGDNPGCSLSTYTGGYLCCQETGVMVIDKSTCTQPDCTELPVDEVYLKTVINYEDATPETRAIVDLDCCDLPSRNNAMYTAEFDVVPCSHGTPDAECIRRFETIVPLEWSGDGQHAELAYALPHVHEGGLLIELHDALTDELVCSASVADGGVRMGSGSAPGDEAGYITGFRECTWGVDEAPRFARGHPMRLTAVYNASRHITGAMARILLAGHLTTEETRVAGHLTTEEEVRVVRELPALPGIL